MPWDEWWGIMGWWVWEYWGYHRTWGYLGAREVELGAGWPCWSCVTSFATTKARCGHMLYGLMLCDLFFYLNIPSFRQNTMVISLMCSYCLCDLQHLWYMFWLSCFLLGAHGFTTLDVLDVLAMENTPIVHQIPRTCSILQLFGYGSREPDLF